jgi:phage gp16-like protein
MKIDEKRIAMLMKTLDITREEALELEGYDADVTAGKKTEYDLTAEQQAVVSEMTRADSEVGKRKSTRKPNELKEAIVREIAEFLAEDALGQMYEAVQIANANRTITFAVGEKRFELNLIEKRAPKP